MASGVFRALRDVLLLLLTGGLQPIALPGQTPGGAAGSASVERVTTVGFTVSDMDRSVAFFSDVLTFEKISDVEVSGAEYETLQGVFPVRMRKVRMGLGREEIELTEYLAPRGRPIPTEFRSQDRWFQHIAIVVGDMDAAYRRLRDHKVEHVSPEPQRLPDWNPNAGGVGAFYFRDPDGHVLEVISFPEGKGDPRWREPTVRLFLGIDHTAIVVDDTDRSLPFYRDQLGFRVAGESENYGSEQERLNAVFGARLRITGLRAPQGPGIEFLDYLTPGDGRPMPEDERASDLFHWETTLGACHPEAVERAMRAARATFVSPGLVTLPGDELGFREGFLVRDPDGHVMRIAGVACG